MKTKAEFIEQLRDAYARKTLLIEKHNPNNITMKKVRDRSVISYDVSANLLHFINFGIDRVYEYYNTNPIHFKSPVYYEIVPIDVFSIPSSGVTSFPDIALTALDRIIAVVGPKKGLHIYGEDSLRINKLYYQGKLINKKELL